MTRTAIVASDHVLIPAKAHHLSTLGIPTLRRHIDKLTREFNSFLRLPGEAAAVGEPISPDVLGVVFTMVGIRDGNAYQAHQPVIARTRDWAPVFRSMVRENKSAYANAAHKRVPVVLAGEGGRPTVKDLENVTDEFLESIEGVHG